MGGGVKSGQPKPKGPHKITLSQFLIFGVLGKIIKAKLWETTNVIFSFFLVKMESIQGKYKNA